MAWRKCSCNAREGVQRPPSLVLIMPKSGDVAMVPQRRFGLLIQGMIMTETTFTDKIPALPAWRVIWEMLRFRPWLWFIDLACVALIRFCWQVAPALIIKAFFDMLTGAAPLKFGVWAIVAFILATWIGRIVASYGFYYADVPIFADIPTLLRKNLLRHILRRPGA